MANIELIQKPTDYPYNYWSTQFPAGVRDEFTSLDFADTPIVFGFKSKDINNVAVKSTAILSPNWQAGSLGANTFEVYENSTYTIFGEVFTAVSQPENSNQFYAGPFSFQKQICDSLARAINSNLNLNYRFKAIVDQFQSVNGTTYFVRVIAKFGGTNLNLLSPNLDSNFVGPNPGVINPAPLVGNAGANKNRGMQLQNYNYKTFIEIFVIEDTLFSFDDITNYDYITTLQKNWTDTNKFQFNIAEVLRSFLKTKELEPWTKGTVPYNNFYRL